MASSTIRKAIGAVKDQTSISLAKVAGNIAPELEVMVVKATTHDGDPPDDKYVREIIDLISFSRGYVSACIATISKRLSRTRDWIVAVKALMLVHGLLLDAHMLFEEEIAFASRRGLRVLNLSDFRDEAHSNSWDHGGFVRVYALYLDEKVEFSAYDKKMRGGEERDDDFVRVAMGRTRFYGDVGEGESFACRDEKEKGILVKEMTPERVLERLFHLLRILDRVLSCRPTGEAKNNRLVLVAFYMVVKDSFRLYVEICEALGVLLDRFTEMEYANCLKGFDTYVRAAKMIDELVSFYNWCKDVGIARSSEFPEVQRITDQLLETLEGFLKEMSNRPKSPERIKEENTSIKEDMNEVKALPPPEILTPPPVPPQAPKAQAQTQIQPQPKPQQVTEDLVNLKDNATSADEQGNKLAMALFAGPPTTNTDGSWVAFPSNGEPEITSAWKTPAAESGKADWELALVETASNLSKQKAALAGGFDPLLLNGMYDQGAVKQHVSTSQLSGGSASSVMLPTTGKNSMPMLALPAPDGTTPKLGQEDPFAASLSVPPPAYVQMAEMERKQQLLVHEQQLWQQYGINGMQGQMGLNRVAGGSSYGMPPYTSMEQPPY